MADPIFIVGCIRSGTTILHQMMLEHLPNCAAIDRRDFEGTRFWSGHGLSIGCPLTGTRCLSMSAAHADPGKKAEIRSTLCNRRVQIVNKNPHLSNKIGLLQSIFPGARFVHIVRSVLAVVSSTRLHFERVAAGHNKRGISFVHYWPEEQLPCWWAVAAPETKAPPPATLRERVRRLRDRRFRLPKADHMALPAFIRQCPDPTRYYPGEGFERLAESWVIINANILRQVDELGLRDLHTIVTYEELVQDTRGTLERLAEFCQIDGASREGAPETLDVSRMHLWSKNLSAGEVEKVVSVERRLAREVSSLRTRLPERLFSSGTLQDASGRGLDMTDCVKGR